MLEIMMPSLSIKRLEQEMLLASQVAMAHMWKSVLIQKSCFIKDVSINTHLSVLIIHFTRIGAIDNNTLIVTDDLSVNGNIFSTNFDDLSGKHYILSSKVDDLNDLSTNHYTLSGEFLDLSNNFDDLSGKHYSLSGTVDGFEQSITTTDLSVNSISVKSGNIIQFSSEVSFNQHVSGTDASFSALSVGQIDGSLVVMGDLSVNGQIFSADGVVGGGGGSGTDASFDRIAEFTDGSGITFLNDVSINGNIFANNLSGSLRNFTLFNNAAGANNSFSVVSPVIFS